MNAQPDGSEEVRSLLLAQVPELASGVVEIKGIVRERGYRTIIAVWSTDTTIDPVGACVGQRGVRIKGVVQQLSGEMIDVVRWSESLEEFTRNLIAPVPVGAKRIVLDEGTQTVIIHTKPDYMALILGRQGVYGKLLARLLGRKLQVVPEL